MEELWKCYKNNNMTKWGQVRREGCRQGEMVEEKTGEVEAMQWQKGQDGGMRKEKAEGTGLEGNMKMEVPKLSLGTSEQGHIHS